MADLLKAIVANSPRFVMLLYGCSFFELFKCAAYYINIDFEKRTVCLSITNTFYEYSFSETKRTYIVFSEMKNDKFSSVGTYSI